MRWLLAVLCLVPGISMVLAAQEQTPRQGSLAGVVRRVGSGEPIGGARVKLLGAERVGPATPDLNSQAFWDPEMGWLEGFEGLPLWLSHGPSTFSALSTLSANPATIPSVRPSWWNQSNVLSTTTAADGRFAFNGLAAGRYRIAVEADGFSHQDAPGIVRPDVAVRLAAGQTIGNLAIEMTPTGSLEGRIHETGGGLLANIPVELWRYYSYSGDDPEIPRGRGIETVGSAVTDDRGWYRMFWIPSGEYYLSAGGLAKQYSHDADLRPLLFYSGSGPGRSDRADAAPIAIEPGVDRTLDWTFPARQSFKIRVRVTDSQSGRPPTAIRAEVYTRAGMGWDTGDLSAAALSTDALYDPMTGVLEIPDLVPGTYSVTLSIGGEYLSEKELTRNIRIDDMDADGGVMDFSQQPPEPAPVRVRFVAASGSKLPELDETDLFIHPELGQPFHTNVEDGLEVPVTRDTDRGYVDYAPVAGKAYRVSLKSLPAGWYVREARLAGADALRSPVPIRAGDDLEITLSPRAAVINGVVKDAGGKPVPDVYAVLIPNAGQEWPDLYKFQKTDPKGQFGFESVPPGDYTVYAWEEDALPTEKAFINPTVVARFAGKGSAVHVDESSRVNVNVALIPATGSGR